MRLLVLDDEKATRDFVAVVAAQTGIEVDVAETADAFYELLDSFRPDAIVLDIVMPHVDGNLVLMELGNRGVNLPVLLISAYDNTMISRAKVIAQSCGIEISGALKKPVSVDELISALGDLRDLTADQTGSN